MKKVKLIKRHTHNGMTYAANAEIEVNPSDADWLTQRQIIDQPRAAIERTKALSVHDDEVHK